MLTLCRPYADPMLTVPIAFEDTVRVKSTAVMFKG